MSIDERVSIQNRKLRGIVNYAYHYVPYYRSLYLSAGLVPNDIQSIEDLPKLPVTTKDDLRKAGLINILSNRIKKRQCVTLKTSGSTGKPFTVHLTKQEGRLRQLLEFRGLLSIGFRSQDRLAVLGAYHVHRARIYQRLGLYRSDNISLFLPIEEQINRLVRFNPSILWFYPTPLRALLHHTGGSLPPRVRPRILISSAEMLDDGLKKAFPSINLYNFYGSLESGRIAVECPAHEGLHVNADQLILETLQDKDRLSEKEAGPVVITVLHSYAMPFIRYRLGDIATLKTKRCSCGCSFPLIKCLQGRENDIIQLNNGRAISPNGLRYIIKEFEEISQFRIVQKRINEIVLLIVKTKPINDGRLETLKQRCHSYFKEPMEITVRFVDYIKETKLKYRDFVSMI